METIIKISIHPRTEHYDDYAGTQKDSCDKLSDKTV